MSELKLSYDLDLAPSYRWMFVTPTQTAKNSLPYIQELGDFPANTNYYTKREGLSSYLIKLCISGRGILQYEGKEYLIGPNQFFWLDCEKPHQYKTDPQQGNWHVIWVHFYGEQVIPYYRMFMDQNNNSAVMNVESNSLIRPLIERMMSVYDKKSTSLSDDLHAAGLLTTLMIQCIQTACPSTTDEDFSQHIQKARQYINEHYKEKITLDILASELNLNKFYLQKLFKKHMGITPGEYLTRTRIQHTKDLLHDTDEPIGQIALDVGIDNIGHFIRQFKAHEGVTLSVYRKQWQ